MTVTVRLFAAAADAAGRRACSLDVPEGASVGAAVAALTGAIPALAGLLPRCLLAVDRHYATADESLRPGAELAIIPPVSGGDPAAALCHVTREPIRIDPLLAHVSHSGAGAVVVFLGNVRGVTGPQRTSRLDYEAYQEMAEDQLQAIAAAASEAWPGVRLAMVHRVGSLAPGETAVAVAASAPHRDAAFAAARQAIEAIKQAVPIWKREVYADGRSVWVDHA